MEQAILAEIESAKETGRPVLLPQVRRLDELFERIDAVPDLHSYKSKVAHVWKVMGDRGRPSSGRAELSTFCGVSGRGRVHKSLDVTPRSELVELITRHMLLCDGYVINFEIVVRTSGTALVTAHYNQISGSRWLAIVDAAQVLEIAG